MKKIIFEILARIGFWIPCNRYMPPKEHWDWVLISHVDCCGRGFRGLPSIGEYSYNTGKWHTDNDSETFYIQNDCVVTHWHKLPGERLTKKPVKAGNV